MEQSEPIPFRKPGTFVKGIDPRRKPPSKRKPKQPNKITRDLKQGLIDAAEAIGADGQGKDGLTGYLKTLAVKHPKAFAGLLGKIIPLQVNGAIGQYIASVNIVSVPADRYLAPEDIARLAAPALAPIEGIANDTPETAASANQE